MIIRVIQIIKNLMNLQCYMTFILYQHSHNFIKWVFFFRVVLEIDLEEGVFNKDGHCFIDKVLIAIF